MYFAEDLGMVKLGQPPANSLRAVFDAQATACLCAGSRDLVLQRSLSASPSPLSPLPWPGAGAPSDDVCRALRMRLCPSPAPSAHYLVS